LKNGQFITDIAQDTIMKKFQATLFIVMALAVAGCSKTEEHKGATAEPPALTQGSGAVPASAGGVSWLVPSGWKNAGERPMRVATYTVPSGGNAADAECAVFHFGSGQGGDVKSNIDRWVGQFENPSAPVEETKEINGLKVTTVSTSGTYLAPSGPMMQSAGKMENFMLLGAIVEGPQGSVFFKMTGPSATVESAKNDFNALLGSLK
jgi:hypothetical protein